MRLRTQFNLAFFCLAILPLAAIVLFSYLSSQRALREAVRAETERLTEEMDDRMLAVRQDLARRVHRVGELPFLQAMSDHESGEAGGDAAFTDRLLAELGEAAPFVQSFEFTPRPGAPLPAAAPSAPGVTVNAETAETAETTFVINVGRIVSTVEARIAESLEGVELDAEDRAALEKVKIGVDTAAAIVAGIRSLTEKKDAIDLGELHIDLGDAEGPTEPAPVVLPRPPAIAAAPPSLPAAETAEALEQWEVELERWQQDWEGQQSEWRAAFREWRAEWADARREQQREALERRREELRSRAEERKRKRQDTEPSTWSWGSERVVYFPVREEGEVVGAVRAEIASEEVLRGVLAHARRERGEIPFALDPEGNLYTLTEEDRGRLDEIPLGLDAQESAWHPGQSWVVTSSEDPTTGLRYGIARPIGESLTELRKTAARNFAWGLGLIVVALVGMRPLSRRLTGSLQELNAGVDRIAGGDLEARVHVHSRNEIGQLARAFNHMAEELEEHQSRLLEEERRRRDQEVERKLLEAEYARKSEELEEARRFQLSLLPTDLPRAEAFELAVHMETATEVGGDYYDFRQLEDGALICAVGDATGHGARAGTMVTIIKSLFSALSAETALTDFLEEASRTIKRMELGRMAMALKLARLAGRRLTLSAAGMPPGLLHRAAGGGIEELLVEGMPLGGLATGYREVATDVAPGDTLLLMSDGFPELPNADGEPYGYRRVREAFGRVAPREPSEIVAALRDEARAWRGDGPPNDDITFVVLRFRG